VGPDGPAENLPYDRVVMEKAVEKHLAKAPHAESSLVAEIEKGFGG
jgi:hypothetical protein